MVRRISLRALSSAVLFALLVTAFHPQPAFADEGTPPPDEPAAMEAAPAEGEAAAPADESAVPSEDAAQATAAGEATPAPEEAPTAKEPVAEDAAAVEPETDAPAEVLADLPEGTSVAVVDAQGEPVPLVSDQAEAILASGDPIWCPASVAVPTALAGGCTDSYDSFAELIAHLDENEPTVDGIIWFEKGYDSSVGDTGVTSFVLDGSSAFSTMANYKLTLRGGWNGLGTKTIDTADPSEINARLDILNWKNDVTLSDLLVSEAAGTDPALDVSTSKKVTLTRVYVNENAGAGARIDNADGNADVSVNASEFNANAAGDGLLVTTNGAVTLANVQANQNGGDGAVLDSTGLHALARDVILTSGTFEFNGNSGSGLRAFTRGAIRLKDITANGNGIDGIDLNNWLGYHASVSLSGTNIFSENGDDGLEVVSDGAITANNLVGNANGAWGARLENSYEPWALPVTLTGSNEFKFSGGGLWVRSNGTISLSNVTANSNDSWEAILLQNDMPGFAGDVKGTGYLTANENYSDGLFITSNGVITLADLDASGNGGAGAPDGLGAYLDNSSAMSPKGITLSGTNNLSFNNTGGLIAFSKGPITINNLWAGWNWNGSGAILDNTSSTSGAPQKITLTGESYLQFNGGDGINASSYGGITMSWLAADENAGDGAVLDNYLGGSAVRPMGVTLSGNNYFCNNSGGGLEVRSLGNVLVSNLNANSNGDFGARLVSGWSGALGAITLTGTSSISENGASGLEAHSRGNITLADLASYRNGGYGLYLNNANGSSMGTVTVGTSRAGWCNGIWDNTLSGLEVYSFGAVSLSNLCTGGNGDPGMGSPYGWGARIDNSGLSAKAVTLKGTNSFNGNYSGGLSIESLGAISGGNITASDSLAGPGARLYNQAGAALPPVTLAGTNAFHGNAGAGLELHSYGTVTVNNLAADRNGGMGAVIATYLGASSSKSVTINGYASASENASYGLIVSSLGAIRVAHLTSSRNLYGAWLTNSDFAGTPGVTLTGSASTSDNTDYGLRVTSNGTINITLTDALISGNGGDGWSLDNSTGAGGITLSASAGNITFSDNGGYGLLAQSRGAINVTALDSHDNGEYGAHLTNDFSGAVGGISLGGPRNIFSENGGYGLRVDSRGAIVADYLVASGNGGVGAFLANEASGPSSPRNVTLNGDIVFNTFNNNADTGLVVYSYGALEMNFIVADDNGQGATSGYGAIVDNYLSGHPLGAATTPKPVTIIGPCNFHRNLEGGLSVVSLGAIRADDLGANSNGGDAVYLNNQWGQPVPAGVTLTQTGYFDMNEGTGLVVHSHGAITLSNLRAGYNGGDGAYLDTYGLASPQKVTLTGVNEFDGNGNDVSHEGNGLEVRADGDITISNLTARWNSDNGAYLDTADHYAGLGIPSLRLTGASVLSYNYRDGLAFDAEGMVYLYDLSADDNAGDGIQGSATGEIYVCRASLTNNADTGWYLSAYYVTLQGVFSFGNSVMNGFLDGPGTLAIFRSCS